MVAACATDQARGIKGMKRARNTMIRLSVTLLIVLMVATVLHSFAGAATAPNVVIFQRPPVSPVKLPLAVLLKLDQQALSLMSLEGNVEASALISSYKKQHQLPKEATVDLCQVIDAAANWIPTAEAETVPFYVSLALALHPREQARCSGVVRGSVRLDAGKADTLLGEFATRTPSSASKPPPSWDPGRRDPILAALVERSRRATVRGALSIGKPSAYYVKALLHARRLQPSYRGRDPDRYVLVDLAFTVHEQPLLEYESILFRVNLLPEIGKVFTHAMMPEVLLNGSTTTKAYEIQASGIVVAVPPDKAGKSGWGRIYERLVPRIQSYGLGETGFSWAFLKSKFPLVGSKNPSVVVELPDRSVGRKLRLFIQVRAQITLGGIRSAASSPTTCFLVVLRKEAPDVSQCP